MKSSTATPATGHWPHALTDVVPLDASAGPEAEYRGLLALAKESKDLRHWPWALNRGRLGLQALQAQLRTLTQTEPALLAAGATPETLARMRRALTALEAMAQRECRRIEVQGQRARRKESVRPSRLQARVEAFFKERYGLVQGATATVDGDPRTLQVDYLMLRDVDHGRAVELVATGTLLPIPLHPKYQRSRAVALRLRLPVRPTY